MSKREMFLQLFKEFNNEDACYAILGNLQAESGLKSNNMQNSYEKRLGYNDETYTKAVNSGAYSRQKFAHDAVGYGLAQWTYWTRKQALYDYCKAKHKNIDDAETQIDFLITEIRNNRHLLEILRYEVGIDHLTEQFMKLYERPANQSKAAIEGRIKLAKQIEKEVNFQIHMVNPDTVDSTEYYEKSDYDGKSIIDALKSIGEDSSKANRAKIALVNGIENYSGKASENTKLLKLFKEGKLKVWQE
jgi:hypothetical protein